MASLNRTIVMLSQLVFFIYLKPGLLTQSLNIQALFHEKNFFCEKYTNIQFSDDYENPSIPRIIFQIVVVYILGLSLFFQVF